MIDRARLTPVDVVFFLVSIVMLGALAPVFLDFLSQNAYQATTPQVWLLRLLLPTIALTVLALIYTNAVEGFQR